MLEGKRRLGNSVVSGFLVVTIVIAPAIRSNAEMGPCTETAAAAFQNTIACTSSGCTGQVRIIPQQKECKSTDESPCTESAQPREITYQPKAVPTGNGYAYCADAGCWICLLLAIAVPPPGDVPAVLACLVACQNSAAFCCLYSCEQDLTTRFEVPGGTTC